MSTTLSLVAASTNLVRLKGLRDVITRLYPTDAVVTFTLFDANGSPFTAATAIAMPYVAASTGRSTEYRGTLPASVPLTVGASCTLKITATDSVGDVHVFQKSCLVVAG